jgi:hypothetical protein
MGTLKESVKHGKSPVKPDRVRKHKGALQSRPLRQRISCSFASDLNRTIKAPAGTTSSNPLARRHVEFVFQRDLFKIGHQSIRAGGFRCRVRAGSASAASPRHHPSHIFMPDGIFFMRI